MATTCDLITLLGKEDLTKLQTAIGPAQTYIPTYAEALHPIASAIGVPAMNKICREFGGSTIWIGNGYANLRRNEEIIQLVLDGHPKDNVAALYGITPRYVKILTRDDTALVYGRRERRACRTKTPRWHNKCRTYTRRAIAQGLEQSKA